MGLNVTQAATGARPLEFGHPIPERVDAAIGRSASRISNASNRAVGQFERGVLYRSILMQRAEHSVDLPDGDLQDCFVVAS